MKNQISQKRSKKLWPLQWGEKNCQKINPLKSKIADNCSEWSTPVDTFYRIFSKRLIHKKFPLASSFIQIDFSGVIKIHLSYFVSFKQWSVSSFMEELKLI